MDKSLDYKLQEVINTAKDVGYFENLDENDPDRIKAEEFLSKTVAEFELLIETLKKQFEIKHTKR